MADIIRDEWERWQQGGCGTYAAAVIRACPWLSIGSLSIREVEGCPSCDHKGCSSCTFDQLQHWFAHDDQFAYDSAGVHRLPYLGVEPNPCVIVELDSDEWDGWDLDVPITQDWDDLPPWVQNEIEAALAHATRHGILPPEPALEEIA